MSTILQISNFMILFWSKNTCFGLFWVFLNKAVVMFQYMTISGFNTLVLIIKRYPFLVFMHFLESCETSCSTLPSKTSIYEAFLTCICLSWFYLWVLRGVFLSGSHFNRYLSYFHLSLIFSMLRYRWLSFNWSNKLRLKVQFMRF